jgi:hypothetical protein
MTDGIKKIVLAAILALSAVVYLYSPLPSRGQGGGTPGNTPFSRWRPTRELPGVRYVGSARCAECHAQQVTKHTPTPMARAAASAIDCDVLIRNRRLAFRSGPYSYQITRRGNENIYTVTDGVRSVSEPILFCFGQGVAGQTYIFRHDGALYESRVSYYRVLNNLDFTIQHPRGVPPSLEDALGRRMNEESAKGCFSCHTTAAVVEARFQPERLTPGVSCEACHGPGEKHVEAVKEKKVKDLQIFYPGNLDALELSQEFCGACHMSFEKVMGMAQHGGPLNVRFQPYRIFNSSKHLVNDYRMSCVACHDPHDKLEHDASFYDSKCLSCHLSDRKQAKTRERSASACPVGKRDCATCHMPKVELPETHFSFTDHWIRIVKPGAPVPN